ncbi:MAG: beta-ketoacyl-[acyl-carrier-protein] synthase family protein, partial [Paludibacteraceae bacterium]
MRIAITGIGLISAIGLNRQETVTSLLREESGVCASLQTGELPTSRDKSSLPLGREARGHEAGEDACVPGQVARVPGHLGRVALSNDELRQRLGISPDEAIGRCALLGIAAAREAIEDAGIYDLRFTNYNLRITNYDSATDHTAHKSSIVNRPIVNPRGVALISGTTVGGMDCTERYWEDWQRGEHTDYISQHEAGETTRQIAAHLGSFSYIATPSTACSSALNAIMVGANLLRTGRARCAVVGGTECLSRFHISGFHSLMILDPALCRPFSGDRAGLNLGEGAGYLVLESEDDAIARGAKIWGYLSGYANTCDAYHQTASSPDGEGAYLAMRGAMEMAGLRPEEIDYINAHGTGTPNNDLSESRAIYRLFGDHIPAGSSTKPFTGHT